MKVSRNKVLRNKDGLTEEEFLAAYKPKDYARPSATADILILGMNEDYTGLKLLLIKRGNHPYIGTWALPGGFINEDESAQAAAARELEEETGLKGLYLDEIGAFTKPGRDPRTWVISVAYLALVSDLKAVAGYDDAADAAWFDLTVKEDVIFISNEEKGIHIVYSLRKEEYYNGALRVDEYIPAQASDDSLAFDHIEMIIKAVMKLREQVNYGNQAFCLVGEEFTLPELQAAYEAILGRSVYKKSFRDMVQSHIEETGTERRSKVKNGRKSKLYTLKYDNTDAI